MKNSETPIMAANQLTIDWKHTGVPDIDLNGIPEVNVKSDTIKQYQSDGVVLLHELYADWVDELRAGLQKNLDHPTDYAFPCESTPTGSPGRYFDSYCNWLLIPEYFRFVTRSTAAAMAGQLMESVTAQFFHDHSFCKEPGTQQATPWHQDLPYYCVDGRKTVSLYVALDSTPADVALQFVRGSHQWGRTFHPVSFFDGTNFDTDGAVLEAVPDLAEDPGQYEILSWDLKPGDCIAFDFRCLHGTTAGEVKNRRRAVSMRWLGDDVVYCDRAIETSPPYLDIDLQPGDTMREDWFPVLWRRHSGV